MSHAAALSYAAAARITMSPREIEANALVKAAARLQAAGDGTDADEFDASLAHNRKLWTIIAGSVSDSASLLPDDLKAQILTLANFIFNTTLGISGGPAPEKVVALVRINRELAAGLRGHS